jgi:hypothetical protein
LPFSIVWVSIPLSDDEGEEDYYNKEISMDELEGAVSRLKIDSAPGPDNIFSKLLINAVSSNITVLSG